MSEQNRPEWHVGDEGKRIYSDNYEYDAMLVLSGYFDSVEERKQYADRIALALNESALFYGGNV